MGYIDKRLRLSTVQAIADKYGAKVGFVRTGIALPRCYCLTLSADEWLVILNPLNGKPIRMLGELTKAEWDTAICNNIERIQQRQAVN